MPNVGAASTRRAELVLGAADDGRALERLDAPRARAQHRRGAERLAGVEQRERQLSLVGPRDEHPHAARHDEDERARLHVVAESLTGLAMLEPERICNEGLLVGRKVVEQRVTEGYRE